MLLAAMRTHGESSELVECGCKALHNLACNSEPIRLELVELGAVQIVCDGLRLHEAVATVQQGQ